MSDQYQGEDFAAYVERERDGLNSDRQVLLRERDETVSDINRRVAEIDRELAAIDAYEQAKTGKWRGGNGAKIIAGLRDAVSHAKRARRGDVSESVMSVIAAGPARRGDILNALGVKGDKPGEISVSNTLTRLKGHGRITRREDGYWVISEPMQQAAE